MHQIPGVTIEVFHQETALAVAEDGYVGQYGGGHFTLQAIIPPSSSVFGLTKQVVATELTESGRDDKYHLTTDLLQLPEQNVQGPDREWFYRDKRRKGAKQAKLPADRRYPHAWRKAWLEEMLAPRCFPEGTKVFGRRITAEFNSDTGRAFVCYPDNELYLLELVKSARGQPTNHMRVWRLSLTAQYEPLPKWIPGKKEQIPTLEELRARKSKFFCNLELAYDAFAHSDNGEMVFPRVKSHGSLHQLLYDHLPAGIVLPDIREYKTPWSLIKTSVLAANEGVVKTWFTSNGTGSLLTKEHGEVRVHWQALAPRPESPNGKRYLVPGEMVQVKFFGKPHERAAGKFSQARSSKKFTVQAYGVTVPAVAAAPAIAV